jgi:hypothetical protein
MKALMFGISICCDATSTLRSMPFQSHPSQSLNLGHNDPWLAGIGFMAYRRELKPGRDGGEPGLVAA